MKRQRLFCRCAAVVAQVVVDKETHLQLSMTAIDGGEGQLLCWFLDAGKKEAPHAQLTGVQKAPRHEVAGSWVPAGQRALWGFNAGAKLDDRRDGDRIRAACPDVQQFRRVH